MATSDWFLKFPGSQVTHLRCDSSNHVPIFINSSSLETPPWKKVFRFEEIWVSNSQCTKTVEAAWTNGGEDDVLKKFEKCSKDLEWWDKNCFGVVRCELEERKKMLAKVEAEAMNSGNNFRARELNLKLTYCLTEKSGRGAKDQEFFG